MEIGERVDDRDVLWNLANAALQLGDDRARSTSTATRWPRAREAGAVHIRRHLLPAKDLLRPVPGLRPHRGTQQRRGGHLTEPEHRPTGDDSPTRRLAGPALGPTGPRRPRPPRRTARGPGRGAPPRDLDRPRPRPATTRAKGLRAASTGDSVGALHHLTRFRLPVLADECPPRSASKRRSASGTSRPLGHGPTSSHVSPTPPAGRGRSPPSPSAAR